MRRFALLAALLTAALPSILYAQSSGTYLVRDVIDGDTIVLQGGETVRYIGIDTPEMSEPYWLEARVRNMALVLGRHVEVVVCDPEPRDKYGRLLAWVYSDGVLVNEMLLREGLGRTLTIPPCGLFKAREFESAEAEARSKRLGLWGRAAGRSVPTIGPGQAWMHIGQTVRVEAVVRDVGLDGNGWYLDFGGIEGFRAVVPQQVFHEFERRGVSLYSYKDRMVAITGVVVERRGRLQMLIDSPSRIE